jgi:hypothetical protein
VGGTAVAVGGCDVGVGVGGVGEALVGVGVGVAVGVGGALVGVAVAGAGVGGGPPGSGGSGHVLFGWPRQKLGAAEGAAKLPEASCGLTAMRSQCQRVG